MASVESDVMKSSVKCSQLQPVVNSSLPDDDRIHNSFAKMQGLFAAEKV
jgi:hypothetical protein